MCALLGMLSTTKPPSLVLFCVNVWFQPTENEGLGSAGRPPSPLYLGSLCWKVSRLQTRLNKQTGREGNLKELHENLGNESGLVSCKMSCCVQTRQNTYVISDHPQCP